MGVLTCAHGFRDASVAERGALPGGENCDGLEMDSGPVRVCCEVEALQCVERWCVQGSDV